jgi:hypothetical protein
MSVELGETTAELGRQMAKCLFWVNERAKGFRKMAQKKPVFTESNEELPGVLFIISPDFFAPGSVVG